MDFLTRHSKILLVITATIVLVGIVIFGAPRKAEAQYPVTCINCSTLINDLIDFAKQLARWELEDSMKALRDLIAKQMMDMIVQQTVNWVQGGGTPKFVTDWQGFLRDAGNVAFSDLVNSVGAARLCQPFRLQIRQNLLPVQSFPVRLSCSLDQVVNNIDNFYTNFDQGGWLAYNSLWAPNNNIYGQQQLIYDQYLLSSAEKVRAAQNEALSGNGYLGVKRCIAQSPADGSCLQYETVTPGAAVGSAVAQAITSDSRWAQSIESWTSALVNALINRLVGEGLSALR